MQKNPGIFVYKKKCFKGAPFKVSKKEKDSSVTFLRYFQR